MPIKKRWKDRRDHRKICIQAMAGRVPVPAGPTQCDCGDKDAGADRGKHSNGDVEGTA